MKTGGMIGCGLLAAVALCASAAAEAGAQDFALREQLGYGWSNACVTFALTTEQARHARAGKALLGPGGKEATYQLVGTGAVTRLVFQADLTPYTTASHAFSEGAAKPQTDLQVTESAEAIRIVNGRIGVEVRKRLQPGEGPIARLRLGSGLWTGNTTLTGGGAVAAYKAEVVARGPIFAEILCRATFADQGTWTLRVRVERAEPVVLVDEQSDAPAGGVFRVMLGDKAFQPTHLLCRNSDVTSAVVESAPIASYFLEPWLHWNNARHGTWIALYTPSSGGGGASGGANADLLVVGLLKPSLWVDPQWKGRAPQAGPNVQATVRDGLMTLDLPVQGGRRVWLLGALDKAQSADILMAQNRRVAPPPQKLIIKHGDFPLDVVKDYVLDWRGDEDNHPLLHIRQQDLPALKARIKSNPAELKRWSGDQPINKYLLDGPIREFIATGDPKLGKLMAAKAEEYLQTCVDWYLTQDDRLTPGAAPHNNSLIITVLNLVDPVLSTEAFTPEARKRVLARLAFLGYVVSSPDFWAPERGFSGFANMTSVVALYRTGLGCMLPAHPQAKVWAEQGLGQLSWQLKAWSDEQGGWLEAPHYAMVSLDHMLAGFTMAANAGYAGYGFDPRLRKVFEWFATISTPRDSRTGGFRHQPPIGNTYHGEPSGICGVAASMWKEQDPDFAARMQWMFEQGGSFGNLGIGWNFPSGLGYRFLMKDSGVIAKPADFGSAWFTKTGVALRNTMQSDRETYLHLIAGPNHDHYDIDSGSIILYGKGRALADDWGYIGRHPEKWHSMLTSSAANGGGIMNIDAFAPSAALDYVSGRKGAWQRQIAFAKDADPLGPTFFVIRDTHAADTPALWRLWLAPRVPGVVNKAAEAKALADAHGEVSLAASTGKDGKAIDQLLEKPKAAPVAPPSFVTLHGQGAAVSGVEDVDLDIFFYEAGKLNLTTEEGVQGVSCGYRDGKEGPLQNAQTALLATLPGRGAVTALLYPRLKTEPPPKVTWSAGGTVVQVETAAGTDCVFLAPQAPYVASDGKSLLPLDTVDQTSGHPAHRRAGASAPFLLVNDTEAEAGEGKENGFRLPPRSIAVHPGPSNAVTAVWQSPISGTVRVEARIFDADPAAIGDEAWRSDGVLAEIRKGMLTLAKAAIPNSGPEAKLAVEAVAVAKGELVRLVILPGPNEWWDTTKIEMTVRDAGGKKWDLCESLQRGEKLGNDLVGDRSQAVWWVCEGDAATFDARALSPVPAAEFASADGKVRFQGTVGAARVRGKAVTLTLGAAGRVRAGDKELADNAAASRTESR